MDRYRIKPGKRVRLADWDPSDKRGFKPGKAEAEKRLDKLRDDLVELQEVLYAEGRHRLLVVLQGMDTSGKDGVIHRIFQGVNPQGVRVVSFKTPSSAELARDYLWRVHQQVPGRGEIVIFNRSHYEDVLIVRVHELVPKSVWRRRYDQIADFERLLAEEGTTILKFFLHISLEEQKVGFEERLADPTKIWKFNPNDLKERARWPEYMRAYEEAISRTSTDCAPWYVVPADRKWFRDLLIAETLVGTLKKLKMKYPQPDFDPAAIRID
ncbi:MAG TPA: polyphosphate kinase 2 family protein [Acidobacteriota bacterium]|nr:polyphosphate kinase 2 family protein [Acidobacteriota bacterium]HQM65015.1 polyphosphate kinase 2 family protein [Acidobacteriota bacterium]